MLCDINTPVVGNLFNSTTMHGAMDALYNACSDTFRSRGLVLSATEFNSEGLQKFLTGPVLYLKDCGGILTLATRITELVCSPQQQCTCWNFKATHIPYWLRPPM
ncbi:MAG: hypothetical protein Q8K75_12515 [Chlamydiales bacterium]|nr:hypothetical protein [Chlamydiales bacterium]